MTAKGTGKYFLKFHKRAKKFSKIKITQNVLCRLGWGGREKETFLVLTENRYHTYDNNNILTFLAFLFRSGNWSGSFRLNDFDGWHEKGSNFPFYFFTGLSRLWKVFFAISDSCQIQNTFLCAFSAESISEKLFSKDAGVH